MLVERKFYVKKVFQKIQDGGLNEFFIIPTSILEFLKNFFSIKVAP
jgi:hypothetical protein